ncbi:MAG TPA: metallophosphoesterase [Propionibacteriaceae bacterium]|nr:metallophosphoesterase [Propionibacteriaceae bacterium]
MRRLLAWLAGALLIVAVATQPVPAAADVNRTGSCVDGGGVTWKSKVVWGNPYKAADGVIRVQVNYAGWTTARPGVVPTDSRVTTLDGSGKVLQTLTRQVGFDYKSGAAYDYRNPLNPPHAPGKARITVSTGVNGDGLGNCMVTFVQPNDPVVAAAGDVACAPGSVVGVACQHKAVSDKILTDQAVGTVLALGDLQYPNGALADFKASYGPTWGRLMSKTRPVPGNHEYNTAGATGYYDYFGTRAGSRTKGYYSFDIGTWHIVALNSERDTSATGTQVAWLKADLRAHPNKCVAAIFHTPRWSGGPHGDAVKVGPFVKALYDANAELILNGHDHDYERFYPMNPSGVRDNARGIVEIVSGLGGASQRTITPRATTAAANNTTYGYTRLVLRYDSADISYVSAVGTYQDSTRLTCH